MHTSQEVKDVLCEIFNMLFSYEDKYIADFQICVSVPLKMYCPNTLRVYTETMLPFECFTIDFY